MTGDQGVGRRRHRLEGQIVCPVGGEHLRVGVALQEGHADPPARPVRANAAGSGARQGEAVVQGPTGETRRQPGEGRLLAGGEQPPVEGEAAHGRQVDPPPGAGQPRQAQVRMEAEAHRHRPGGAGDERGRHRQRLGAELDGQLQPVGEGEDGQQLRRRPVQVGPQRARAVLGHAPDEARPRDAVDGKAPRVRVQQGRRRIEGHRPTRGPVAEAGEPVGPGVDEREAGRPRPRGRSPRRRPRAPTAPRRGSAARRRASPRRAGTPPAGHPLRAAAPRRRRVCPHRVPLAAPSRRGGAHAGPPPNASCSAFRRRRRGAPLRPASD